MYVAFTSTLQVLVSGSHNSLCSIAAQQVRTKFNDAQRQEKLTKFRLVWLILPRLWYMYGAAAPANAMPAS